MTGLPTLTACPIAPSEGAPEKGWTGNVKMKGKRKLDITAYRCTSCGYLESYANPQIMTFHPVNIDRLKSLGR